MVTIHGQPVLDESAHDGMPPEKLRIAFVTPEFVTEHHFDGGLANYLNRVSKTWPNLATTFTSSPSRKKTRMNLTHQGEWSTGLCSSLHGIFNRLTRYSLTTTLHWLKLQRAGLSQTQTTSSTDTISPDSVSQLLFLRHLFDSLTTYHTRHQGIFFWTSIE
jgi:hypothetical protein